MTRSFEQNFVLKESQYEIAVVASEKIPDAYKCGHKYIGLSVHTK